MAKANIRILLKNRNAEILQIGKNFIFVCVGCKQAAENFKKTAFELERYIIYSSREFGMKKPEYFISVYVVGAGNESVLEGEHGIRLTSDLINISSSNNAAYVATNYSSLHDQSIVLHSNRSDAWIDEKLKHQLFHLLNKSETGFNPPWIEEGLAVLFERSAFEAETLIGRRDNLEDRLRQGWNSRPAIKDLIRYDWSNFVDFQFPLSHDPTGTAMPQAMAKYFMLYLQNKGKIKEIIRSMKLIEITSNYEVNRPDAEKVLTAALSMKSIDDIDKDFAAWFTSLK